MSDLAERVRDVVAEGTEADAMLRRVVDLIAQEPGVLWAGVAFVESGELELGPQAGTPDEPSRSRTPVRYQGDAVAELWVDGGVDAVVLGEISALIGEICLVGWDTGGEPWGLAG